MRVTIVAAEIFPLGWELGQRTANARQVWRRREVLLLRIRASDGTTGWGEAAPLPGFSRLEDDLAACEAELRTGPLRCGVLSTDAPIEATLRAAVAFAALRSPSGIFCFESAILDLLGKIRAEPASSLLHPHRSGVQAVPIAALLRERVPDALRNEVSAAMRRGLTTGKLKIGGTGEEDRQRIQAVRETAGGALGLRLDANQSLSVESLAKDLEALAAFEPELLEEPVSADQWTTIGESAIPLAMDESLQVPGATERIRACAGRRTCSTLVLKPMALGGIVRCLELARLAADCGLEVLLTHLFDGPVAAAATAELALALAAGAAVNGATVRACGLDSFGRSDDWPPATSPYQIESTHIRPGPRPGLGIEEHRLP
jgi:L-Ala-D/L-Glu epimerase